MFASSSRKAKDMDGHNPDYTCRPKQQGHTYLTIGQDLFSIENYVVEQYNASLHRGR